MRTYDALALFSGGLDSILAAKTVAGQGLSVLCLHFHSPFFGHPDKVDHWRSVHGLDIEPVDVGQEYVDMMANRPAHGVGKVLNPCVDCKILMLRHCRELMPRYGARMLVTGEVKGQRPMSQRRDALDVISKQACVRDVLLRPLCAKNMKPSPMEESGLVDRERLHNFSGRGRRDQMRLARELGVTDIPQPGGGCKLTDHDSAKRYFQVFAHTARPDAADMHLCNVGRQFRAGPLWMVVGRNQADNQALAALARPEDIQADVTDYPSPLTLLRATDGAEWTEAAVADAAALGASFSPKAAASGQPVAVTLTRAGQSFQIMVTPSRNTSTGFAEPAWEDLVAGKQALFGPEVEEDDF